MSGKEKITLSYVIVLLVIMTSYFFYSQEVSNAESIIAQSTVKNWETDFGYELISSSPLRTKLIVHMIIPNPYNTGYTLRFKGEIYYNEKIVDTVNEIVYLGPKTDTSFRYSYRINSDDYDLLDNNWSYPFTLSIDTEIFGIIPIHVFNDIELW